MSGFLVTFQAFYTFILGFVHDLLPDPTQSISGQKRSWSSMRMANAAESVGNMSSESDIDPNSSPLDHSGTCSTPQTEISTPESPVPTAKIVSTERAWARETLDNLTREEKVMSYPVPSSIVMYS